MTELLSKIKELEKAEEFTNAWGELNEVYHDETNDVFYCVVYDLRTKELLMICTIEEDDDEVMPKEILYKK